MKKKYSKELLIGFTVLITLLIIFFGIDYLKGVNIFKAANYYYASYTDVAEGELNEDFRLLVELLQEIEGIVILPGQGYHVVCRMESTTRRRTKDSFSRVFLDIVDNADRMQELVDRKYPALHLYAIRFNLFQRLDYMLHVPVSQMRKNNAFYQKVKGYLRAHLRDTMTNPYLTRKNKGYLMLFTLAPKMVRRVHGWKMRLTGVSGA